nr:PREDICTED: rab9 effector protein with kelch motifs isoform X3 [Rhinolophus sinicus]XP_019584124.1 PREDICTED: rab9 effector protein with kelch motifs isoform X3 [Rhinolophus sinicus]XP_019584125.1 PREDICTED: rab9 effector protein with kelch motifs isoform X3 [Rhinolophus sinicus]XP_019584126.1 PREDICTED: rab9 effector protein with kelch motifs isoform X3 [Rhinolophus sinicus]XP_019584127.1 PREDICTED: rab9 effector protein with kelch motifs isoform X3 [Rhinolophus sinicus]
MKQLPVLEPGDKPRKATWSVRKDSDREKHRYALTPGGDSPCARVGHSCLYLPPAGDAKRGKVFIVGGADPNRSFSDVHTMDLGTHQWDSATSEGLLPRYEHASFIPSCIPHSIWVFGGADPSGNRNCLQVLNPETRTWTTPEVTTPPPSPRTFHTSSAAIGNQLYVFGGGERGAQPVQDVKLHVFDANTLTWSQPETLGKPPSPRHGHVMVAAGTKLFIHGGLAGDKFYDDLHCIDISDMKWQELSPTGTTPTGCAAHSAVAVGKHLYIFGGMTPTGALDTMYQYHIEKQHWTLLKFDSFLPAGRLDHSMCIIPWPVMYTSEKEDSNSASVNCDAEKGDSTDTGVTQACDSQERSQTDSLLCFVFGGMNTEGEIYNDCIVTVVD